MKIMRVICAAIAVLACGSAGAQTVYTDEAAWAASMPGDAIIPLTGTLFGTSYETTIVNNPSPPGGYTVGATVPVAITMDATNFSGQMNFGSECDLEVGCVITDPLEIDVLLPEPVDGFFAYVSAAWFDAPLTVNGVPLPSSYGGPGQLWGISGAGPIIELDFVSGAGFTDNPIYFDFINTLVAVPGSAPIPEPSGGLLIPAMLLGLALLSKHRGLG